MSFAVSPILEAYRSAMAFANQPAYSDRIVTRAEYQEGGSNACRRKFRDWKNAGKEKDGLKNTGKGKERIRAEAENPAPSQTSKAARTRTRTVSTVKRR